jgi:hypothetical protein
MSSLVVTLPEAEALAALDAAELSAVLYELELAQRRIEAAMVHVTEHVDARGHHLVDGHRSVTNWVMAATNCSRGTATARAQMARLVRNEEVVADEFNSGRLGVGQMRELARLSANPRCSPHFSESVPVLLRAASTLEFADFRLVADRWQQLADAAGAHRAHEAAHRFRDAALHVVGSECRFTTSHGVVQGEAMRDVFEAFCQREFDTDWAGVVATYGDQANPTLMPRTGAQRRADAFLAMVLAAAAHGAEGGAPIDVIVNVVIDQDQFEQYAAAAITGDPVVVNPAEVRNRRCETVSGTPIHPEHVVAGAVIGRIRSIVTDGAGVIVRAGHQRRFFTGPLREAIQAVQPMCGWLGCTIRSQLAQIDHIDPAARGGPTDAANGAVLCKRHNLFKHSAGYHVHRSGDGGLQISRPDGSALSPLEAA